jgi:hypothetical protein
MFIRSAQDSRGRIYEHLPLLWCGEVTPNPNLDDVNPTDNVHKPDFLAFSLIVYLAKTSSAPGFKIPRILGVIAEDATRYFLVIFTSHFVLTMTLALGRVSSTVPPS